MPDQPAPEAPPPPPKPKRRARFQIHLSTAIVLMFASGFLIWMNVEKRAVRTIQFDQWDNYQIYYAEYGWPFPTTQRQTVDKNGALVPIDTYYEPSLNFIIIHNLVVALLILYFVWYVCEWWIRRRGSARKGD